MSGDNKMNENEIKLFQSLDSCYIIKYIEHSIESNYLYLITEYCKVFYIIYSINRIIYILLIF